MLEGTGYAFNISSKCVFRPQLGSALIPPSWVSGSANPGDPSVRLPNKMGPTWPNLTQWGSMVLLYMVSWIPSIYPSHVSIYMDHRNANDTNEHKTIQIGGKKIHVTRNIKKLRNLGCSKTWPLGGPLELEIWWFVDSRHSFVTPSPHWKPWPMSPVPAIAIWTCFG